MKKIMQRIRDAFATLSLTVLLSLNLFFIVFLILGLTTLMVWLGIDGGFFIKDGSVTVGGALVILYAVCIVVTLSIVVMIRKVFIRPIRRIMDAMGELARGHFDTRIDLSGEAYTPKEVRAFAESFNQAAGELAGTELLRKDFINNFSHEFKTPIVSIQGFADLLLEEELPEEDRREYLTIIRDESQRLARLATSILMLNRIESQTILKDRENIRPDEQLRQAVLVTEQKWKEKSLHFETELEELTCSGNAALLQEVWLNLLDNAAKFSPKGGSVRISLARTGEGICAAVTDHGPGMDAETCRHIFDQFYQGDTSHRTEGNGLGLAMVKKIVDLHGGEIRVNTAPGNGSSFIVILPEGFETEN